ncbi:hypothetical protein Dsin_011814 [Dipteronia sinensis]|uniref:non-specific serine/threonine protein kinase n=1 Tax=Dipteronia sinensis TaxID=43782 RepID=A0AAE0AI63_9ROSI|nr:hypothetical protein Dsin_011814 [Dipteronia sinensis]
MMLLRPPPPPFLLLLFAFFWVCLVHLAQAQTNQTQPTTDPEEARTLNSIFQQWGISAKEQWNISGELCSGDAIATETSDFDSFSGPNPYIICVCTYGNNTLCHITRVKVYALNVVGVIPDELWTLTFLTNLTIGINVLSGELPKELGKMIDMRSFSIGLNNFSGPLPSELGSWTKLEQLYIDSSGVSGEIPSTLAKLQNMATVDVSYNNLIGSCPSWINRRNLQLNVVANNLTIDNSNRSLNYALPFGLNCLQRNFPCNRGTGIYYNFSINAFDQQVTSSNDSELFETARISASSLRYYGLGLENGDYNVTLQFAEMAILDTNSWESVGRRVFDIYIQGNRVQKDFDIKKEAGGVSKRAVQRLFTARVSENYLEIHLFWAGKGTCCIPAQGTYGPSISAISAIPNFIPSVSNIPPTLPKKNRTGLIAGIVIGVGLLSLLSVIAILWIVRRRNRPRDDDEVLLGIDAKPYTFSYSVLKTATEDFSPANKHGEGGFGAVYKGKLSDERATAVKQLSVASHQGKSQFVAEIVAISAVQHRNLVKLYGCCIEGSERLLVYEYLESKSLDQALFGEMSLNFKWSTRCNICLGVARGLAYLHEESRLRIIHIDVKTSNILLDSELNPKISHFGLAKLYDDKKTHISTRVAGTTGYLAQLHRSMPCADILQRRPMCLPSELLH